MSKALNIDLNLIRLFCVLYQTRSVKETADKLHLSQSACSHALQRLRESLNDDVFVRVGNVMLPTEYSKTVAADMLKGLDLITKGIESKVQFSPHERHVFRIAVTDYTSWCMSSFISSVSRDYPNIKIELHQLEERLPEQALREGTLDLVCGFAHEFEHFESFSNKVWFEDEYVCARCRSHPLKGEFDLDAFLHYSHILVTPWNEARGILDITLSKMKKRRQVAVKSPNVLSAPTFLIGTSYLLAMPRKYATYISDVLPINVSPLPIDVPNYQVKLYWHKTRDKDKKINWIIDKLIDS
ncbi:LysR family transcriptional regulator [Vibrio caribbeanicus]|uniref:LysR family transcriptional regulator n=1 Tax=Vibrio caribbeanicus TaxID=701175 RepID=UPI00228391DC|nr:LysR family transcriptional regulator [Vibrio caribbeanicus]MCY9846306.1 LysR family transcriptional regulator [Vibrio caribbeanicus]